MSLEQGDEITPKLVEAREALRYFFPFIFLIFIFFICEEITPKLSSQGPRGAQVFFLLFSFPIYFMSGSVISLSLSLSLATYIYVFIYICMYVYMYVCMYIYIYVHICICMYVCVYIYVYICMYVCMYIHIYPVFRTKSPEC